MKKALLVGINNYPAPYQLAGCVHDSLDLAEFLRTRGWLSDDIRVLADERATADNILDRLAWLTTTAKPGDELFFSFSGHGTQVRDRNGDELNDWLDEAIVPVDINWESPFTDDVLHQHFVAHVPDDVHAVVFLDSCHSGSMLREIGPPTASRVRYMPPPVDIGFRALGAQRTQHLGVTMQRKGKVALLSGCRASQTSADAYFKGRPNGAATRALLDEWHEGITWQMLQAAMVRRLSSTGFTQHPMLQGSSVVKHTAAFGKGRPLPKEKSK